MILRDRENISERREKIAIAISSVAKKQRAGVGFGCLEDVGKHIRISGVKGLRLLRDKKVR